MRRLTLIALAVMAAIIMAPRTSTAEHIAAPSRSFVQ